MVLQRRFKCVASTEDTQKRGVQAVKQRPEDGGHPPSAVDGFNFFKSAQWSPDGTCILTNSEDNGIRTFVLPPTLLDCKDEPHELAPYSVIQAPEPVYATAIYPHFNLQDSSTAVHLSALRSHPVALQSSLQSCPTLASYPLIHGPTETYITPHSIIWNLAGTHFLAGSDSLISLFDATRNGQGSVSRISTIPSKRKKLVGGGIGMKGIISALAMKPQDGVILAAGTFTRHVGLYDPQGRGDCIAVFSLPASEPEDKGTGITQLLWSPCGRYLYISERRSDQIHIYDIRVAGKRLGSYLVGRSADTNQRLGMDLAVQWADPSPHHGQDHEIWAGGIDGFVRAWPGGEGARTIGDVEAAHPVQPVWEWKAHDDPVSSIIIHPSGTVAATCSGQRRKPTFLGDDDNSDSGSSIKDLAVRSTDNSLKVWSLLPNTAGP